MSNVIMQEFAGLSVVDGFMFAASDESPAAGHAAAFVGTELLFSGNYDRVGVDLVISNDRESVAVPEYFKGEYRSTLMSPEGASLSGRVVEAMTARVQYAQADQIASAVSAVGNVVKMNGSAVITRNGVPVELKQGDRLLKGDVIQTGPDTTLGISFVDGTALGLASNARIVLDEMTYDPNGSSNSSLLSLVQGAITLVAGHTAKFGNMRVETPVATMGIRGTAVMVEIAADNGPSKFSVLKEPDGKIGMFHLYDRETGDLIKVVSKAGLVTVVSPLGAGQPVSTVDQLKTLADIQSEKSLIHQVFQIYYPNYNPDGPGGDRTGSSVNPLANSTKSFATLGIESGVPALVALASGVAVIPASATLQEFIVFPESPEPPEVRVVAVANVVDVQASQGPVERNFTISDQVTVTVDGQVIGESAGRYIAGSGSVTGVESTVPAPQGVDLAKLVHVDPATGVVTYDASRFAFLGVGESAIYTIGFDSQPGTSAIPETLTLTINGLNDKPTVEHAIPDQRIREGCRFEYVIPACVFADLDATDKLSYRAMLANGEPLPNWLTFDPVTMTFSGTPPKGAECVLHIKVIASDEHNATAVDQFDLVIAENHHHHHHHHMFHEDDVSGSIVSNDHDLNHDPAEGTGDLASDDQGRDHHTSELSKSESASCGDECFLGSKAERGDNLVSSKEFSSHSGERASFDVSPLNTGSRDGNDTRAQASAQVSAPTDFDSERSGFMDTGWLRSVVEYSSQTSSSHHSHSYSAISHSVTFTWNSNSGHQWDRSGGDSFVFRSNFGHDTDRGTQSTLDSIHAERSWSGNGPDVAALVQVMTSFDFFSAHDEQGATGLSLSTELHKHQSDFHLV
jgi:hypothetical protein